MIPSYLNNRYMDASTGTFLSVDPLVNVTGQAYLYGNGNPVTYSDPNGLCASDTNGGREACIAARTGGGGNGPTPGSGGPGTNGLLPPPRKVNYPRSDSARISPMPGAGTVRINLFIPQREVCVAGQCVHGDDRGFNSAAGLADSRATITVDFEGGTMTAAYNYSCNGNGCRDAHSVSVKDYSGDDYWRHFVDPEGGNTVAFNQSGSELSLVIEGRISVGPPGAPSINSRVDLSIVDGFVVATKHGNGFPAYEIYQDVGSDTYVVRQYDAGSPADLVDGPAGGLARVVNWLL